MTASLRLLSLAVLVPLLVTGCGGSDDEKGSADKVPTKAEAEAAAKAINLVAADLSGYQAEASSNEASDTDPKIRECLGLPKPVEIADLSSDDFSQGAPPSGAQVASEVTVVESSDDAKKEVSAYASDKAAACVEKVLGEELKGEVSQPGVTLGELKATKETGASGTDGSFAFTLKTTASALGISIPITFTVDGFLVKHTEVSLLTVVFGSGPTVDRAKLLSTLVDRAKEHAV